MQIEAFFSDFVHKTSTDIEMEETGRRGDP
jgi:hypothetical protein